MSNISPILGPLSPREDPAELQRFNEAMEAPLKILKAIGEGQAFPSLTELHRFEIAKLCAQMSGADTAKKIQSFVLNEVERFEVAKLCAKENLSAFLQNIKKFDLTSEQRFELARICTTKDMNVTLYKISNFDLNDEQRFEIVKLCAQQNMQHTFSFRNVFKLTKEQLLKLAKFTAKTDPVTAIKCLHILGLELPEWLEIVALCVYPDFVDAAEGAAAFQLNEAQRFAIAKRLLETNLNFVTDNIEKFDLKGEMLSEVLTLAVRKDPSVLQSILRLFPVPDGFTQYETVLHQAGWIKDKALSKLAKNNQVMQRNLVERAANILFLWSENTTPVTRDRLSQHHYLANILTLRASDLDLHLARFAEEAAHHRPADFEDLSKKFLPLLSLPLAKLKSDGVNLDSLKLNKEDLKNTKLLTPFVNSMCLLAEDKALSPDKKTQIIQAMAQKYTNLEDQMNLVKEEIAVLSKSKKPTPEMAEQLEGKTKEELDKLKKTKKDELKQLQRRIHAAQLQTLDSGRDLLIILTSRRSDLLRKYDVLDADDLKELASESFQSILPIPEPVDDFMMEFDRTFGHYRQPNALQIYAAILAAPLKLEEDGDDGEMFQSVLKSLGAHVLSIFRGSYLAERYDPTKNPHLRQLNAYNPHLLNEWQINSQKLGPLAGLSIHETDNPEDLLLCGTDVLGSCQKVDGVRSLNQGLVGYLRNGQTRLLAIKDGEGNIVARRLLRLLWDDETKKPVLFLETLYSNSTNPELDKALLAKAEKTAKRLGCPLTSLGRPAGAYQGDYPNPIQSLGGLAPCEYVDGVGGIRGGPYSIHLAQTLYDPTVAAAA